MIDEQIAQLVIEMNSSSQPATVTVRCIGAWVVREIAQLELQLEAISWPESGSFVIDGSQISSLDTSGAWLLHRTTSSLERGGKNVNTTGLRPEFSALLQLVTSCTITTKNAPLAKFGLLARIGRLFWLALLETANILSFIGECSITLLRSLLQRHRIRWRPILHNLQSSGFEALPITGLLSFLMGVVIAYQGADELQRFGANIYIVDLVGLSMLRELSPLLTAIIVAGRSGSAYAAQIGTMKVTEEIDALRTIGIGPIELLVLPKMLALIIALPLLTLYADVTGVLGGIWMANSRLQVSPHEFIARFGTEIPLKTLLIGLGKSWIFAIVIVLISCYQGFRTKANADSVGQQTTRSVVQSIFIVIVLDAGFSIVFNLLDL